MTVWKDEYNRWRYRFQYKGHKHSERGFLTKKKAKAAEALKRQEIKTGTNSQGMAFVDAANEYLDYVQRSMTKETYRQKVKTYQGFTKQYPKILVTEISPKEITSYLKMLKSNDQYNRHRKEMSAVLEYAKNILGIINVNPVTRVPKLPHSPAKKMIPTEKQILSLLLICDPSTDERDLLMCVLLTLARIDEILRLQWEDVNFDNRTITKYTKKRKGGSYEPITVPINEDLYNVLRSMWNNRKQDIWVFYNERTGDRYYHRPKFMKGLCKRAGIEPHFGFHALRHYMSSLLADNKKISTKTIQAFLGHQSVKTTEIYLHSIDSSLTDAMDGLTGIFEIKKDIDTETGTK